MVVMVMVVVVVVVTVVVVGGVEETPAIIAYIPFNIIIISRPL